MKWVLRINQSASNRRAAITNDVKTVVSIKFICFMCAVKLLIVLVFHRGL